MFVAIPICSRYIMIPGAFFLKTNLFECGHRVAYEASGSSSFSGTTMVDRWSVCSTRLTR